MSYSEQLRIIADSYFSTHGGTASANDIAAWAIRSGKWHPQPGSLIHQCAEELSRAMREDYITDPQGRTVRAKHAARIKENGKQITFVGRHSNGRPFTHGTRVRSATQTDPWRLSAT